MAKSFYFHVSVGFMFSSLWSWVWRRGIDSSDSRSTNQRSVANKHWKVSLTLSCPTQERGLRRPGSEENESGHPLDFVSQALVCISRNSFWKSYRVPLICPTSAEIMMETPLQFSSLNSWTLRALRGEKKGSKGEEEPAAPLWIVDGGSRFSISSPSLFLRGERARRQSL